MAGLIPFLLKPSGSPTSSSTYTSTASSSKPSRPRTKHRPTKRKLVSISYTISAPATESPFTEVPVASSSSVSTTSCPVSPCPFEMNRLSTMSTQSAPIHHRRRPSSRLSTISEPETEPYITRRLSLPAAMPLPSLPSTPSDWTRTLVEVKRLFTNRTFKKCAARCTEILDNTRDLTVVDAAHLIYLHFYAAASLEQTARPMHSSSPVRSRLLQQAREHYCRAEDLAHDEDDSISRASRRSSAGSICSHSTTVVSTAMSSPTGSVFYSNEPFSKATFDERAHSRASSTTSTRKRVAFIDTDLANTSNRQPIVRPDSPTLGFENWSRQSTPEPPVEKKQSPTLKPSELELSQSIAELVLPVGPLDRYASVLYDLRRQISTHIEAVDSQITHAITRSVSDITVGKDEMRALELRSRIERLRAINWRRPRFDAKPYEALRETVLSEI